MSDKTRASSTGGVDVALCQAVALAEGVPEWVQLLQAGVNATHAHSGPFTFDPGDGADIIAASKKASPDGKLVIDLNHATDLAAPNGQPSPAQGWIEELEARPDGLWGKVRWTEAGKSALADRAYRFISPVITYAKATGKAAAVLRASLTNNPNLRGLKPVLNHVTQEQDMSLLVALCAALGIAETTDEPAALAAVKSLKASTALNAGVLAKVAKAANLADTADEATVLNAVTTLADPTKTVPAASFLDVQTALNSANARIKALEDGSKRKLAEDFVDGAIKDGVAGVKPSRDHFVALHMADPAGTEKMINGFIRVTGSVITDPAPAGDGMALNSADEQVIRAMGLDRVEFTKFNAEAR